MDLGVKYFSIDWDVETIFQWMKEHGGKTREELDRRFSNT